MQEDAIVTCFKCEAAASASCAAERDAAKNAPASLQPLAPELDEVRRAIPSLKCDTPRRPSRYLPKSLCFRASLLGFTHSPPSRPLRSLAHKTPPQPAFGVDRTPPSVAASSAQATCAAARGAMRGLPWGDAQVDETGGVWFASPLRVLAPAVATSLITQWLRSRQGPRVPARDRESTTDAQRESTPMIYRREARTSIVQFEREIFKNWFKNGRF